MQLSKLVLRLLWRRQTIYVLEAALVFCAPFNYRNWYTLTINIVSVILNFLPRYLFQRFLQTRPQIKVMHHILISLVYAEYMFKLGWIVIQMGNYFPVSVLGPLMTNHVACSLISIYCNLYLFHLFLCILLLSVTKLLINKAPFWYDGLDHDRLKIWIHSSLAVGSIAACFTGYRAITWNYCDGAIYTVLLSLFGIAYNEQKHSQNYPDLAVIICITIFLHIGTVCLGWKREKIDPLRTVVPQVVEVDSEPVVKVEAPSPARKNNPGRSRTLKISAWSDDRHKVTKDFESQSHAGDVSYNSVAEIHHERESPTKSSIMKRSKSAASTSVKRIPKSVTFNLASKAEGGSCDTDRIDVGIIDLESNEKRPVTIRKLCQSPSSISAASGSAAINEIRCNVLTEFIKFSMKGATLGLMGLVLYLVYLLLGYVDGGFTSTASYFLHTTSVLIVNLTFTHQLLGREEPREFAAGQAARWAETVLSTATFDACKVWVQSLNAEGT